MNNESKKVVCQLELEETRKQNVLHQVLPNTKGKDEGISLRVVCGEFP